MESEKNQNVSTKKVNILDKITKRSDYIRAQQDLIREHQVFTYKNLKERMKEFLVTGLLQQKKLVLLLIEIKLKADFVMR